jgi:predicted transposase YbfD/YdcC
MAAIPVLSIRKHFASLRDPRVRRRRHHRLLDIIVIALCGVIADCDTWQDIELFAKKRSAWFRRFLGLPRGIPSHDTLERVFDRLNPQVFAACLCSWVQAVSEALGAPHIAIDGKTLRRSFDSSSGLGPLHLVGAWATKQSLALGQVAVENQSNEITAIPRLLEVLDLRGALVTLDAMGCQKAIAQKIIAAGGDYLMTVKNNQERLYDDIEATVHKALEGDLPAALVEEHTTAESSHGRQEERSYVVVHDLSGIRDRGQWPKLKVVGMCFSERTVNGYTSIETRYFIGSRTRGARYYGRMLRDHWRIENSLHWQLDVTCSEDDSRIQRRNGAQNFAALRRVAISLLKQNPSKLSLRRKRKSAAFDTAFLEEILRGRRELEQL